MYGKLALLGNIEFCDEWTRRIAQVMRRTWTQAAVEEKQSIYWGENSRTELRARFELRLGDFVPPPLDTQLVLRMSGGGVVKEMNVLNASCFTSDSGRYIYCIILLFIIFILLYIIFRHIYSYV